MSNSWSFLSPKFIFAALFIWAFNVFLQWIHDLECRLFPVLNSFIYFLFPLWSPESSFTVVQRNSILLREFFCFWSCFDVAIKPVLIQMFPSIAFFDTKQNAALAVKGTAHWRATKTYWYKSIRLEHWFETLEWLPLQPQLGRRNSGNIDCLKNKDSVEEVPSSVISAAVRLLNLCSFFSTFKVGPLNFLFRQQTFGLDAFRELFSSTADYSRIANGWLLLKHFKGLISGSKSRCGPSILYIKITVKALQR